MLLSTIEVCRHPVIPAVGNVMDRFSYWMQDYTTGVGGRACFKASRFRMTGFLANRHTVSDNLLNGKRLDEVCTWAGPWHAGVIGVRLACPRRGLCRLAIYCFV